MYIDPNDAGPLAGFVVLYALLLIGFLALSLYLGYLVMRTAVVRGLRRARHEQRIEKLAPGLADWLEAADRKLLADLDPSDR